MPLFGAVFFSAPNKGTTVLFWFRSLSTVLIPTEKRRIKDFTRPMHDFPVLFKAFSFSRTFQESPLNSSTLQACANPGLSGRVLDSRSRYCEFKSHRRHCIVSLNKALYLICLYSTVSAKGDPSWLTEKLLPQKNSLIETVQHVFWLRNKRDNFQLQFEYKNNDFFS